MCVTYMYTVDKGDLLLYVYTVLDSSQCMQHCAHTADTACPYAIRYRHLTSYVTGGRGPRAVVTPAEWYLVIPTMCMQYLCSSLHTT